MAEDRKIDFKITILWALLLAFEELLTFVLKYQNRIAFLQCKQTKYLVTLRKTSAKFTQAKIKKVRTFFFSSVLSKFNSMIC